MKSADCAIVGIGATEFSKNSGRTELRLALESITQALDDAGVEACDVDGLVTLGIDNNDEMAIQRNLGVEALTFFARVAGGGGGGCGCVGLATSAIASGRAKTVVCYRALNERSQQRFALPSGRPGLPTGQPRSWDVDLSWVNPYGMVTPAAWMALLAQRYLHDFGASTDMFGRVAVTQRQYAVANPNAFFFERPMTLAEHQGSRMIADPLRLLDCCQESDGAVALVVTSQERAKDLKQKAVSVLSTAQGIGPNQVGMATVYRKDVAYPQETQIVGDQLWARSGLRPSDVDVANIYDHFSCAVPFQLEALGFCGRGEAEGFIADGALELDGELPTNTNGGLLSEAYIHGFNGITEMVRQLRGVAINQVSNAQVGVVTSGSHAPTSGMLLGAV